MVKIFRPGLSGKAFSFLVLAVSLAGLPVLINFADPTRLLLARRPCASSCVLQAGFLSRNQCSHMNGVIGRVNEQMKKKDMCKYLGDVAVRFFCFWTRGRCRGEGFLLLPADLHSVEPFHSAMTQKNGRHVAGRLVEGRCGRAVAGVPQYVRKTGSA